MTFQIGNNVVITSDRLVQVNSGTTRPTSPAVGMLFFNTSTNVLEVWNGAAWKPRVNSPIEIPSAWGWGYNGLGQLGDGTFGPPNRSSPVSVVGGITDWVQIIRARGRGDHTIALRANGTIWTWGTNSLGGLGDNTTSDRPSPVSVVGGFTDWVQIGAGRRHSVAIRTNGTAWCWGSNLSGGLGDGTTSNRSSPVSVIVGFTDWVQISAGGKQELSGVSGHTVGIRANGTAWAWGANFWGQVGDNTTTNRSSPVSVVGGFTDWVQISAGSTSTAAIRANGTAWGWGYNSSLGDNTTSSRLSPVSVVGGFTDWVQISAGAYHTAAVRANGTAWAWGTNTFGRLGDNTTTNRSSPVSVVGGFTDWVQIDAGYRDTAAIRANGTAWGWGFNSVGAVGDGTTYQRSSPVSVVGGFTDWVQISSGRRSTAALRSQPR